jgi:Leucine-rich repeat (LRR) protein
LEGIGFESKSNDYFSGISINNLVFRDSTLSGSSISSDIFSDMKVDDMKVLTFINVNLEDENPLFWTIFKPFENLRAIHIENGKLTKLDSSFGSIPAENILTAEFDNIGLEVIETNTFKNWKSLKMLTITDNLIKHFEWIPKSTELWNLDLRRNKIKTIPKNLHELLPNLRVLKLDDNNLRYIPYDAIKNLKEFSFEGIIIRLYLNNIFSMKFIQELKFIQIGSKNSITPDSNSLCANGDMTWILEYTENLNFKLPQFLLNSLFETKCKVFNGVENVYKSCHELKQTEFSCDDSGKLKSPNLFRFYYCF